MIHEWPDEPTGKRCDRCGHVQTLRDWTCHCLTPPRKPKPDKRKVA